MKVQLTVCDVCKSPDKPTETYTIAKGGVRETVDLCAEDALPIERVLSAADSKPAPRRSTVPRKATRRGGATPILTEEELAAKKKK